MLSYYHQTDPVPLVERTFGQHLELAANKFANTEAIVSHHENEALTYPELLDRADKLAAGLANLGIQRGDRIGLWMPNKTNWYISMMGIARLGGICVPLNPGLQVPEVDYSIKKVRMKAIITTEEFKTQNYYRMLTELFPELGTGSTRVSRKGYGMEGIIVDSDKKLSGAIRMSDVMRPSDREVSEIRAKQNLIQPDNASTILFTSGTTGKPKGAMQSHFSLVNCGIHIGRRFELNKSHVKMCLSIPFFHGFALAIAALPALEFGATIYLPSLGFDPVKSTECIKKHRCNAVFGTPTMYVDLITEAKKSNQKLDSLRFACTGGAPISPKLLADVQMYLGVPRIRSVFGMSESGCSFTSMSDEEKDRVLTAVGKVQSHFEAKVVDANHQKVPFGTPGELWVRGYGTMLGYYGDDEKTRDIIGADKWIKTGDKVILYEDGYAQVVGRIKEMINRGGENIYPKEIEDVLITHPDIVEVYVAGVPDDRMGEEVAAFIKLEPTKTEMSQAEMKEFCKRKLAHFKIPRFVKILTEFPKTTSGKVQKFKLVEDYKNAKY